MDGEVYKKLQVLLERAIDTTDAVVGNDFSVTDQEAIFLILKNQKTLLLTQQGIMQLLQEKNKTGDS